MRVFITIFLLSLTFCLQITSCYATGDHRPTIVLVRTRVNIEDRQNIYKPFDEALLNRLVMIPELCFLEKEMVSNVILEENFLSANKKLVNENIRKILLLYYK